MAAQQIEWVGIPAGTLQRGTPPDEVDALTVRYADTGVPRAWYEKETPRTRIVVPAFRLARTPVTVAQWAAYAEETGARASIRSSESPGPKHPPSPPGSARNSAKRCDCRPKTSGSGRRAVMTPASSPGETNTCGGGRTCSTSGSAPRRPSGRSPTVPVRSECSTWPATSTSGPPPGTRPGAPDSVPAVEDWAADPHITRGGAFRHDVDLARCARRHGAYEADFVAVGIGFRLAASAA